MKNRILSTLLTNVAVITMVGAGCSRKEPSTLIRRGVYDGFNVRIVENGFNSHRLMTIYNGTTKEKYLDFTEEPHLLARDEDGGSFDEVSVHNLPEDHPLRRYFDLGKLEEIYHTVKENGVDSR